MREKLQACSGIVHLRVDLNADVGEGIGQDPNLIPILTSVNIACGGHAGDAESMRATVALAHRHGVAVGAHPSFPDRPGFGRREMTLSEAEIESCVLSQVRALAEIAAAQGVLLRHVKAHGALYNLAARDAAVAGAIARAVATFDPSLILVGLAGSALISAGARVGLRTANEVFADRGYRADATLVPREEAGSVIHDAGIVVPRAVAMVRDRAVTAADGTRLALDPETICLHGDTPGAADLAFRIRQALIDAGVELRAMAG
jgi:UPF0271 protein